VAATAMPDDVKRGQKAGFFRYVTKLLDVKAFRAIAESALAEASANKQQPQSLENCDSNPGAV
jgi:hypothetical protein